MTDITKLLDEHPLPWRGSDGKYPMDGRVCDARGRLVCGWALPTIIAALANALHAERQKNAPVIRTADELDQIAQMKRNIVSNANRIGRAFELIGKVEARLDAIANAARGSDE